MFAALVLLVPFFLGLTGRLDGVDGWMDGWMDNQANARLPTSEITDLLVSDEICSLHSIYPSSRRPPPYNLCPCVAVLVRRHNNMDESVQSRI